MYNVRKKKKKKKKKMLVPLKGYYFVDIGGKSFLINMKLCFQLYLL